MVSKPTISTPPPPFNIQAVPPQIQVSSEEEQIDLRKYFRIVRKSIWHILLATIIVVGAVTFYTLRQPKIYKATASLQIETRAPSILGRQVEEVSQLGTGTYWSNKEYYETQYKVIKSRDVASRVVKKLKLHKDQEFLYPIETLRDPTFKGDTTTLKSATDRFQAMVIVEPVKDSRLVLVSIEHPNPAKAQMLANEVAEEYKDYNLEVVLESTINAVNWLSNQLQSLKEELKGAETNLYEFKLGENILSVSLGDRQNYLANDIDKISDGMSEMKKKRIELTAKKKQLESISTDDPLTMPITPLLESSLVQELKNHYAQLTQQYAKMEEEHDVNWPPLKELDAERQDIKASIKREVSTVISSIRLQYKESVDAEEEYRKQMAMLQKKALDLNLKEIEYNSLFREKENTEKLYSLVLSRTKEADLQKILKANNIRILDRAIKPEAPIKPRVKLNILLGLIIGLLCGIALAFLREYMDITVKTQEEVEQELGLTFLGIVPSIGTKSSRKGRYYGLYGTKRKRKSKEKKPEAKEEEAAVNKDLFVFENPKSSVAECVRAVRTNILFMAAERPIKNVLITSPAPQEGKTTMGISLAITMAQSGNRTLIIDADMRRPRVHKAFDLSGKSGISSAILGMDPLSKVICKTKVENLDVLPCGPIPPNPAEILHTQRFADIMTELGLIYDRIVIDSPPVIAVTDAVILSTICDGVILVFRPLSTQKSAARQAKRQIQDVNGKILGVVFNDLDLENKNYGYYHYYYSRKYGYYQRYETDSSDDIKTDTQEDYSIANEP